MSLGVLGPLAVDGDGDPLSPRDRIVLAALAMTPREAVRPDRLADALWGETPPKTWSKVVQGCIVRIRRLLGAEVVRTTRQGYVLDVPDDEIDALRFEGLVARARELLALHEPERARYQVSQALDLWFGPALADLAGWEPAETVARRWDELRRDAEELGVEAALRSGAWREVLTEAGRLVAAEPFREQRWALLARAQYQAGRQGESLSTLQRARAVLAGELGLDPGPELVALEQAILHQDPDLMPGGDAAEGSISCPYRGLLCYDVDHAEQWFGRDAELATCREVLARHQVVAVVGPSGSGKSSLVRAGVAASLRSEGRSVTVMTPGARPMAALAAAGGLRPRSVLVVDQLEEVVTLCPDAAEREAFLGALAGHAVAGAELVLALRADRLGALSSHRAFARVLEQGLHLVTAMDEQDLRTAIEGPARQAGLLLEPGLVDLLVQEVSGEPGALPLLSHALTQVWERREGRTLTVDGYRSSDGIRGAVAQTAERVFLGMSPGEQEAARDLMLRLVVPDQSGEPARSPLPRRMAAPDPAHEGIIELLVAARLVTADGEVVSLAHESLARAWPRLRGWLDADTEGQLILRHLTFAADSWESMGRPEGELYRGPRLARALEWRETTSAQLTETETAFLDAGRALAEAESRSAEQRLREQAVANRRLRGLLGGVAVLLVLAVVAGVLAVREGGRADDEARLAQVRELAAASRAVRPDDPELAVLLALEATSPTLHGDDPPPAEAVEALHAAVVSSRVEYTAEGVGGAVDYSPQGDLFATEGPEDSGLVDIRDAATGESVGSFPGHEIDVNDVAFSPSGRLATAGDDGALRVWDPADQSELAELTGPGEAWGPSFAAERPRLFAGAWPDEGVVRVASLGRDDAARELAVPGQPIDTSISPDGTTVAVATVAAGSARVVDARTGALLRRLDGHEASLTRVAYSPDGRSIATASNDGTVRVRDAKTGRTRQTLTDAQSDIMDLDWSSDSTRLAAVGFDGKARVYDIADDSARLALAVGGAPTKGGLWGVAFSPDGERLITGDFFVSAAAAWDIGPSGDAEVRNVPDPAVQPAAAAYGPDGRLFVPAADGSVAIWDEGGGPPVRLEPAEGRSGPGRPAPGGVAVSADGSMVATGESPAGATVWDVKTGEELWSSPGQWLWRPAFSPDGRHLAFAGDDEMTVTTPEGEVMARLRPKEGFGFRDPVFSPDGRTVVAMLTPVSRSVVSELNAVAWTWEDGTSEEWSASGSGHRPAFSPDGSQLAIADVGALSRVVDVASGEVLFELEGVRAGVADLAYSPDGETIATAGVDGKVMLWDSTDGSPLLRLPDVGDQVNGIGFSPDGRHLVAGSTMDDVMRVWTLDVEELRRIAATKVVRGLTEAECREYLHAACPGD